MHLSDPIKKYDAVCQKVSKKIAQMYTTSFYLGIIAVPKIARAHIYNIYALVRYADEIVDTFHYIDKPKVLKKFTEDTYWAIHNKYSSNPVLHSFQITYNLCNITPEILDPFFLSMEMDINNTTYDDKSYNKYIYGSAEVVGLMCLKVYSCFSDNNYEVLKEYGKSMGAAFQKINFLRDVKNDYENLGRMYFPNVDFNNFKAKDKKTILLDINKDLEHAYIGVKQLTPKYRKSILLIYVYYKKLFEKIIQDKHNSFLKKRQRISNIKKYMILIKILLS